MVSGLATLATSASALRPSRWPISPRVARSASDSFILPFNWAFRMRFSAAKYSFRAKQLLMDRSGDVGQDARPVHYGSIFGKNLDDRCQKNVADGLRPCHAGR